MQERKSIPASAMRHKSLCVVSVLILGLAAAIWWLQAERTALAVDHPALDLESNASPVAVAAADPIEAADARSVATLRDAVASEVVPPADRDLVRIRVVGDDDAPVPRANVISMIGEFDWTRMDAATALQVRRAVDLYDRLEVVGITTIANDDGIAMVPRPTHWPEVLGRAPGKFGSCLLDGPEPEGGFVLRLVADETLVVRAHAADGAPAPDLCIALAATYIVPGAASGDVELLPLATTDAAGVAIVHHLQLRRSNEDGARISQARVVVFAPGLTDVGEAIDLTSLPPDGIDLALPETGSLRVDVRDRDGSPLRGETVVLGDHKHAVARFFAAAADGVARFPVVGLHGRFHVESQMHSESLRVAGPGPQRPGEEAVLVMQLPDAGVTLHGRAVDANGVVLANGEVGIDWGQGHRLAEVGAQVDSEGRFVILLDGGAVGEPLDCVMRWLPSNRGKSVRFRGEDVRLAGAPLSAGKTHLGDVVFRRAPLLATGRVFGVLPLPQLDVSVARATVTGEYEWVTDIGVDLHEDGSFEVFGRINAEQATRHLLQFSAADCVTVAPVWFRGGERDLKVVLQRGASLEAHVLVDDSVLQHPEVLVFETRSAVDEEWYWRGPEVDGSQLRLRIGELLPESTSLRVRLAGSPDALVTIENLQLRSGEVFRDPRLQAIDLRSVRAVRLRLVDVNGSTRDVGGDWLPTRRDRADDYLLGMASGIAWIGCRESFDVLVFGEGLLPVRASGPARDTDVPTVVEPAMHLHFDGLPAPPANCRFLVAVQPLTSGLREEFAADVGSVAQREYWCPDDGSVTVRVAAPGLVRFRLHLVRSIGKSKRPAEIVVREVQCLSDGEQHRFDVAAQDVQRALSELGLGR